MTRIFVVAGEASGDQHAAGLVRAVRSRDPSIEFSGMGGDHMASAGVDLFENLVERSVMGIRKVIAEMGSILEIAARFVDALDRIRPDALILVDYPGLNLNLARIAKAKRIPVIYDDICPQVWAWAPWRVRRIASRADKLIVILPFEEPLYRRWHSDTVYVGNPVFDHLARCELEPVPTPLAEITRPILAVFPGSRRQEVDESLPSLLSTARSLRDDHELEIVISCQRKRLRPVVDAVVESCGLPASVYEGQAADLQRSAHLSLVVSGTVTLEQAFFAVPMVVVYPVRRWERWAFRFLSVTPFVALANLFAGTDLVPEILFASGEEPRILEAARPLWEGPERRRLIERMEQVKADRLQPGATERAADEVLRFFSSGGA